MELGLKQRQFNAAMERYNTRRVYRDLGTVVALVNVSLQIYLLWRLLPLHIGPAVQAAALLLAFAAADLVNGIVHMYMDHNDRYESVAGPLIANFHLHHKTPKYRKAPLLLVYFNETGSKVWLVGYLLAVAAAFDTIGQHPLLACILVYAGIFSSIAEVSHYLCHSSDSRLAIFLGNAGILLSKRHHARHHLDDNRNYAFLNGMSDPLLNLVARGCCGGYKTNTDAHFAGYRDPGRECR